MLTGQRLANIAHLMFPDLKIYTYKMSIWWALPNRLDYIVDNNQLHLTDLWVFYWLKVICDNRTTSKCDRMTDLKSLQQRRLPNRCFTIIIYLIEHLHIVLIDQLSVYGYQQWP